MNFLHKKGTGKFGRLIISTLLVATFYAQAVVASEWIPLRSEAIGTKTIVKDNETEIMTLPSTILLNITHTSKVELFTILGKLVCSDTLQPGSYEYQVEAHGIYILRIGDLTCKVAL